MSDAHLRWLKSELDALAEIKNSATTLISLLKTLPGACQFDDQALSDIARDWESDIDGQWQQLNGLFSQYDYLLLTDPQTITLPDGTQTTFVGAIFDAIVLFRSLFVECERGRQAVRDVIGEFDGAYPAEFFDQLNWLTRSEVLRAKERARTAIFPGVDNGSVGLKAEAVDNDDDAGHQPRSRVRWLGPAVMLVKDYPDWSNKRIAKEVGVDPSQLSRSPMFRKAAAMARSASKSPRKGRVTNDPDTGLSDVEAIDN